MLEIIPKNTSIDFIGKRRVWIVLSAIAMLAVVVGFFTKGLNYGIDFTGGAEVQIQFKQSVGIDELRGTLQSGDFKNVVIQQIGEPHENSFLAKFRGEESELQQIAGRIEKLLAEKIGDQNFELSRIDVVGPRAGDELRRSGFLALFYALMCILLYVAVRFDYRYGPGAIVALVHDALLTIGVFVFLQKEFSLQIVAAILTIIGYSNNDTIIVYDRIREAVKLHPERTFEENVNRSINETLSRTILTSACTLIVVAALMFFGGPVLHDFAFTMCIGIVIGTYSSIFIASPILIVITRSQEKRARQGIKATRTRPDLTVVK